MHEAASVAEERSGSAGNRLEDTIRSTAGEVREGEGDRGVRSGGKEGVGGSRKGAGGLAGDEVATVQDADVDNEEWGSPAPAQKGGQERGDREGSGDREEPRTAGHKRSGVVGRMVDALDSAATDAYKGLGHQHMENLGKEVEGEMEGEDFRSPGQGITQRVEEMKEGGGGEEARTVGHKRSGVVGRLVDALDSAAADAYEGLGHQHMENLGKEVEGEMEGEDFRSPGQGITQQVDEMKESRGDSDTRDRSSRGQGGAGEWDQMTGSSIARDLGGAAAAGGYGGGLSDEMMGGVENATSLKGRGIQSGDLGDVIGDIGGGAEEGLEAALMEVSGPGEGDSTSAKGYADEVGATDEQKGLLGADELNQVSADARRMAEDEAEWGTTGGGRSSTAQSAAGGTKEQEKLPGEMKRGSSSGGVRRMPPDSELLPRTNVDVLSSADVGYYAYKKDPSLRNESADAGGFGGLERRLQEEEWGSKAPAEAAGGGGRSAEKYDRGDDRDAAGGAGKERERLGERVWAGGREGEVGARKGAGGLPEDEVATVQDVDVDNEEWGSPAPAQAEDKGGEGVEERGGQESGKSAGKRQE